jgi:hypothetical protein
MQNRQRPKRVVFLAVDAMAASRSKVISSPRTSDGENSIYSIYYTVQVAESPSVP